MLTFLISTLQCIFPWFNQNCYSAKSLIHLTVTPHFLRCPRNRLYKPVCRIPPSWKTADGELALKYSWRAFHRTPRTPVWTEMFHTSCWTSPNNPPSTDLTSAALKLQGPAGLLIAWRACGAGPSTSAARIRMRRQQRSKHRTAMQKWEQKLLKKKRLKKKKKKGCGFTFSWKHELN